MTLNSVESKNNKEAEFISEFFDDYGRMPYFNLFERKVKTIAELYQKVYSNYPLGSDPYEIFRKFYEDYWLKAKYPREYVLCVRKISPYPNYDDITFMQHLGKFDSVYETMTSDTRGDPYEGPYRLQYRPRWEVEWNPNYVHFVVGCVLHTADNKYVILKRLYGNEFKGLYSPVMGHCAYSPELVKMAFSVFCKPLHKLSNTDIASLLAADMYREIKEEIGIDRDYVEVAKYSYTYIPPVTTDLGSLSYYHAGFIFKGATDLESGDIKSQEPDKNAVTIKTLDELSRLDRTQAEPWLLAYLREQDITPDFTHTFPKEMYFK